MKNFVTKKTTDTGKPFLLLQFADPNNLTFIQEANSILSEAGFVETYPIGCHRYVDGNFDQAIDALTEIGFESEPAYIVMKASPQIMRKCVLSDEGWQPIENEEEQFLCILSNNKDWVDDLPPYGCILVFPEDNERSCALADRICNAMNRGEI